MSTLAAEGGYQEFTLGTAEWAWLLLAAATAVLALIVGAAPPAACSRRIRAPRR
jgi:hypothetical protein